MAVDVSLQRAFRQLHRDLGHALAGVTEQQLYFCPSARTNHIAFLVWHAARTEDIALHSLVQGQPTVWQRAGLDAQWGPALDRLGTGTGMAAEQAQAVRVPSVPALVEYADHVWEASDRYLESLGAAQLEHVIQVPPSAQAYLGLASDELPTLAMVALALLVHGNQHLGELWLTRELLGLSTPAKG